jgi:predicted AAA+ superfamily ATPase
MVKREIQDNILSKLFKKKILIVYGPRQVGKTTLIKELVKHVNKPTIFFNTDDFDVKAMFEKPTIARLKSLAGDYKLIIIDEAQRIENIGLTLKLFCDEFPGVQVIASGSSAFELSDKIKEPLTGRSMEYKLFPLSWMEMSRHTSVIHEHGALSQRLVYGYYPEVINNPGNEKNELASLAGNYLYRDVLAQENIRKPWLLDALLKAIAVQIGSEVSYNNLSKLVKADVKTIEHYIDLLEKSFIIFRLPAYNRNVYTELKKGKKIYFWDLGIRNALLGNFTPAENRNDLGALWENFLIVERLKNNSYTNKQINPFFWRTINQTEIDYVEESNKKLDAFEFKYIESRKRRVPEDFAKGYPGSTYETISKENYIEWLIGDEN